MLALLLILDLAECLYRALWTPQLYLVPLARHPAVAGGGLRHVCETFKPQTFTACADCDGHGATQVNPDIRKEKWTEEEDAKLMELVRTHGNSWAEIARGMAVSVLAAFSTLPLVAETLHASSCPHTPQLSLLGTAKSVAITGSVCKEVAVITTASLQLTPTEGAPAWCRAARTSSAWGGGGGTWTPPSAAPLGRPQRTPRWAAWCDAVPFRYCDLMLATAGLCGRTCLMLRLLGRTAACMHCCRLVCCSMSADPCILRVQVARHGSQWSRISRAFRGRTAQQCRAR